MKLLYLSADNLRNTPFIKDLVFNFKGMGKCILVHDHFGAISDTRFVTKRLSALLSEELITNNAFSGDQRGIYSLVDGQPTLRTEFLTQAFKTVDAIVLNALGSVGTEVQALDPLALVEALRKAWQLEQVYLFARNGRSPLVAQPRIIRSEEDVTPLRPVYEEEAGSLDRAVQLAPAVLAAPSNFKSV